MSECELRRQPHSIHASNCGNRKMDNIVRLSRPQNERRIEREGEAPAQSADIVIFPGVRYERWDDEVGDVASASTVRSVQRDFIEL